MGCTLILHITRSTFLQQLGINFLSLKNQGWTISEIQSLREVLTNLLFDSFTEEFKKSNLHKWFLYLDEMVPFSRVLHFASMCLIFTQFDQSYGSLADNFPFAVLMRVWWDTRVDQKYEPFEFNSSKIKEIVSTSAELRVYIDL